MYFWKSIELTFNRRIDIPVIYLQLKHSRKSPVSPSLTFNPPATSFSMSTHDDCNHPHSMATNNNPSAEIRD
jgi:hypothetical protein